ncbi:MAG: hypothetical protein GX892_11940 [Thermoanaerobacteraceae bacterium]|nr:hypothetical protein [Thermoanaerobacteraceae bacterium]
MKYGFILAHSCGKFIIKNDFSQSQVFQVIYEKMIFSVVKIELDGMK